MVEPTIDDEIATTRIILTEDCGLDDASADYVIDMMWKLYEKGKNDAKNDFLDGMGITETKNTP